jgi:beta-lactamase class A
MTISRRSFLAATLAGAVGSAAPRTTAAASGRPGALRRMVIREFEKLPGRKSLKIVVPPVGRLPAWSVERDPDLPLFVASAIKAWVLAEFLRQVEAGTATLEEHLPVDDRIWSFSSPVLTVDPPDNGVTGIIQARVALEAMIGHSDDTATDIALKRVGPDAVRAFIAGIGLLNSRIPDSTRQFFGYLAGSPNWQHLTWRELVDALVHQPKKGPPLLNDVVTLASTANDLVSFYSRALQGEFFQQEASLRTFRHILTMEVGSEAFPLGLTGFSKGGTFEFRQEHVLSLAGGVFIPQGRWAYFSVMCNWVNGEGGSTAEEKDAFLRILHNIFSGLQDEFST